METTENATLDFLQIHNRTPDQLQEYLYELGIAHRWTIENRAAKETYQHEKVLTIITLSWFDTEPQHWADKFRAAWSGAAHYWKSQGLFWATTAAQLATPHIKKQWEALYPGEDLHEFLTPVLDYINSRIHPDPQKQHTPKKKTSPRGDLWKLNPKWERLWPSSRKIFLELLRRSQFTTKQNKYPWCQPGLTSLHKFTRVSVPQIRRALLQLQHYGLIKRFRRGYLHQGCAKYLVFLTPKMAGAFSHATATKH